ARPIGCSICKTPRLGFLPPKAAVGQGPPPQASAPEPRPLPTKSAMVAPFVGLVGLIAPCRPGQFAMAAFTVGAPQALRVAATAAWAAALLKNRTSPTWFWSIASKLWVWTFLT